MYGICIEHHWLRKRNMGNYVFAVLNVGGAMLIEVIIGYVTVRLKLISQKSVEKMNKFLFKATILPQMCRALSIYCIDIFIRDK